MTPTLPEALTLTAALALACAYFATAPAAPEIDERRIVPAFLKASGPLVDLPLCAEDLERGCDPAPHGAMAALERRSAD